MKKLIEKRFLFPSKVKMAEVNAISFIAVLVILLLTTCQQPSTQSLEAVISQSDYIIEGEIIKLNASTVPIVTDLENAAVVRVVQVLDNKGHVDDFTNREITVILDRNRKAKEGQQGIFFTKGWLYSESIAVIETGIIDQKAEQVAEIQEEIKKVREQQQEAVLIERIRAADVVFTGKVLEVKPMDEPDKRRDSEHDPLWWNATVEINQLLKGAYDNKTIAFVFASSMDVGWYNAPKFDVGAEGIFILNSEEYKLYGLTDYAIVNPLDFQPPDRTELLIRLINQSK